LTATGTVERIDGAGGSGGDLSADMAARADREPALLHEPEAQGGPGRTGPPAAGDAAPSTPSALSSFERDLLKDTLGVVKRFKAQLHHRFKMNALR
jgi:hypothetical protein